MEYFKEKFKNFYNIKDLDKYFDIHEQKLIRDIKKYSDQDPLMNIYISDLLNHELKGLPLSDEQIELHVSIALFYIKKGNKNKVLERLKRVRQK